MDKTSHKAQRDLRWIPYLIVSITGIASILSATHPADWSAVSILRIIAFSTSACGAVMLYFGIGLSHLIFAAAIAIYLAGYVLSSIPHLTESSYPFHYLVWIMGINGSVIIGLTWWLIGNIQSWLRIRKKRTRRQHHPTEAGTLSPPLVSKPMRWLFYLSFASILSAQDAPVAEPLDAAMEQRHRLQKTSALLKTCPDGHPNLKDIPIRYGLFGIQVKDPKDWNDDDRLLARQRDSHEVILGTDALVGGEPRFQPTCLTCGYRYSVRSVPDEDAEWVKSGRKFSDFSTPFSPAALSLPFATDPDVVIQVGVKDGRVVSETLSITLPTAQRDKLMAKLEKWIAAHNYLPSLLQVDPPLPELPQSDSPSPSVEPARQTIEDGKAEFGISVNTNDSIATFTFSLTRM